MEKILCLLYNQMADFEMTLACHLSERQIVTIAYEKAAIQGASGISYMPMMTVKEAIDEKEVVGLIIPGGLNDEMRPELITLIRKLDAEGKMLAAICGGPQYLARAGVLEHKKYTTALTIENLKTYFPKATDPFPRQNEVSEYVVRDQNVITAVGNAFVAFAIEVSDYLGSYKDQVMKDQDLYYYRGLIKDQ